MSKIDWKAKADELANDAAKGNFIIAEEFAAFYLRGVRVGIEAAAEWHDAQVEKLAATAMRKQRYGNKWSVGTAYGAGINFSRAAADAIRSLSPSE